MSNELRQLAIVACVVAPLVHVACGSSEDRKFASGTGGSTTGGSGGSTTGGSAGTTSGGTAGSGGSGNTDAGQSCNGDGECNDGNACNGEETCDGGFCKTGTPLNDGDSCTPYYGDAGPPDGGAGEFICATGVCALKCTTDADCEDNDVCTGSEICHPTTKTCLSGTPLACDDNDVCTDNECDPAGGCFYPLIDADMDGHAATSLGTCGDDCNDNDATIYTGAGEACDNKDNNCNNQTDESAPVWYPDCDADTFAPTGAPGVQQCDKPTTPHASCNGNGGWTLTAPAAGTTDCWDKDAKAHPMTSSENNTAWQSVPMSGSPPITIDYDYNCDTVEEKKPLGKINVSTSASCTYTTGTLCNGIIIGIAPEQLATGGSGGAPPVKPSAAGGGGIGGIIQQGCCLGSDGWTGSGPTTCGASANYTTCDKATSTTCIRTTTSKKLECR